MKFETFSVTEMLALTGEKHLFEEFSKFSSTNPALEFFLKERSVNFSRQALSQTHLVYTETDELVGFFTLSIKILSFDKSEVSKTTYKRVSKFGYTEPDSDIVHVPVILVAQLSKNFNDTSKNLISGDDLLSHAIEKIISVQKEVGGKVAFLECENVEKLLSFYNRNDFHIVGSREDYEMSDRLVKLIRFL